MSDPNNINYLMDFFKSGDEDEEPVESMNFEAITDEQNTMELDESIFDTPEENPDLNYEGSEIAVDNTDNTSPLEEQYMTGMPDEDLDLQFGIDLDSDYDIFNMETVPDNNTETGPDFSMQPGSHYGMQPGPGSEMQSAPDTDMLYRSGTGIEPDSDFGPIPGIFSSRPMEPDIDRGMPESEETEYMPTFAADPAQNMRRHRPDTHMRVLHASPGMPPVDVAAGSRQHKNLIIRNLAYSRLSDYMEVAPGADKLYIYQAGTKNLLMSFNIVLPQKGQYTLVLKGTPQNIKPMLVYDRTGPAAPGNVAIRFAHLSPDAPAVDFSIDNKTIFESVNYGKFTKYRDIRPGVHNLRVNLANTNTVVLSARNIRFTPGKAYTVYVLGLTQGKPQLSLAISVDGI